MSQARICLISLRGTNSHAAWCSNYEFEDVICGVDDVDLFSLRPGKSFRTKEWIARRLVWRRGLRELIPYVNPGLQTVTLQHDYELFVYICMNPADLIYLSAVKGWKERCKTKICVMVEFYSGWVREYGFHLSLLQDFDRVVTSFGGSVDAIGKAVGRPCHHVPLAADLRRFSPYPDPPGRRIDVYSIGRRFDPEHRALLKLASRKEIFYVYDTVPGLLIQPTDYREHRDLVANCIQRARFFVAYPAKVDEIDETRGQSEVGARFFEGAAGGAVLVGRPPTASAFTQDFDWRDAVVDVGSSEDSLAAALSPFISDPERTTALGRKNAVEALRRFDWGHRWQRILEIAGLQPQPRLEARLARLDRLASEVESTPLFSQPNGSTRTATP